MKGSEEQKIDAIVEFAEMINNGIDLLEMGPAEFMCLIEGVVRHCAAKMKIEPSQFVRYLYNGIVISEQLDEFFGLRDSHIWKKGDNQDE